MTIDNVSKNGYFLTCRVPGIVVKLVMVGATLVMALGAPPATGFLSMHLKT